MSENLISNNTRGIVYQEQGQAHWHQQSWNIMNNTFEFSSEHFIKIHGSGSVVHNHFRYALCNSVTEIVFIKATKMLFEFTRNNIYDNQCYMLVQIESESIESSVTENIFRNNKIYKSVFALKVTTPTAITSKQNIDANIIEDNTGLDCDTDAIYIAGTREIVIKHNTLNNPNLTYELRNDLITVNDTVMTEATMNYWGVNSAMKILQRIRDGRQKIWTSVTKYSPYFADDTKTTKSSETFELNVIKDDFILGGLMNESLTLSNEGESYVIASDLIVPKGITFSVEETVSLSFGPQANLIVHGQLILRGTESKPLVLDRAEAISRTGCNNRYQLRLTSGTIHEGILEVFHAGTWYPFCYYEWTKANTRTACSQLGLGTDSVKFASTYGSRNPVKFSFRCSGHESTMAGCQLYTVTRHCAYYSSVKITCSRKTSPIRIMSDITQKQSVIRNIVIANMSGIHVTGTPPILHNVKIINSDEGITLLGSGPANEKDVTLTRIAISNINSNGLSLYDIKSNVTVAQSSIKSTSLHGIHLSPVYDYDENSVVGGLTSTFRFCDASAHHYIKPGESYYFFGDGASALLGCRRWLRTDPGYSVMLLVSTTVTSGNVLASFYEGEEADTSRRIGTFQAAQKRTTIRSMGNTLVVVIENTEESISFAMVSAEPARVNDCSFENGTCGWHDLKDTFAQERGSWKIYDCSNGSHATFKGLANDVNYPGGTEGQYIYTGDEEEGTGCGYARYKHSEDSILEGPLLDETTNLCSISFSYYRNVAYYFLGERISLYKKTPTKSIRLWSSSEYGNNWRSEVVDLDNKDNDSEFILFFHVKYTKGCTNSVGLDDIKFEACPEEKLVSTIRVTDTAIQEVPGRAIYFRNTDHEKHNVIWIERVAIQDIRGTAKDDYSTVSLDLMSAYILIRNCYISATDKQAISIKFNSKTSSRICEANIAQNKINGVQSGGVIFANNSGLNNAKIWIRRNSIEHNSAQDKYDTINIENCTLVMENNILYNNTGRTIMFIHSHNNTALKHRVSDNTFWFNHAQGQPSKYTVLFQSQEVAFHNNILNNPSNNYEITANKLGNDDDFDCTNNWWGSGLTSSVNKRIRDGKTIIGAPNIQYIPFLENPPKHFGLSSSCPLGWSRRGPYCIVYNVGAVTYSQALEHCEQAGAVLLTQIRFRDKEYIKDLTSYRDVDGSMKEVDIWINPAICNIVTNVESCAACNVYNAQNNGITYGAKNCDELHPFICQKLSVVLCKNGCFQHGLCVGKTCVCSPGWESNDCSRFHCRDVNNCSGRGSCVGPNSCKCRAGWMGRACSISYCARFSSCSFCSKQRGCGWCDEKSKCSPGTGYGPDKTLSSSCESWFYHQCLTMEGSSTCSNQISVVPCASRYCNKNATERNPGLCQQCQDVQRCYDSSQTCQRWNETRCPNGKTVPNYDDTTRIDRTQLRNDVHVVDNNTLYYCPYSLGTKNTDSLYINTGSDLNEGRIMLGSQCGGIMHRIKSITNINKYQFVVARPVGLREVIRYADFKQSIDTKAMQDGLTVEDDTDSALVSKVLTNKTLLSETIHEINDNIYKCIGHEYSVGDDADLTRTYYVAVKQNAAIDSISVGDIVASGKSEGFLEDVKSQDGIDIGSVAHSRLATCDPASISKMSINVEISKPDMTCQGGDNWPGFLYWTNKAVTVSSGMTVLGRKSGPVLGKVTDKHSAHGFVFFELVPASGIVGEYLYIKGNISHVQKHFRVRRSIKDLFHKLDTSLEIGIPSSSITPKITFNPNLDVVISLKWNWRRLTFDFKASASFHGTIGASLNARFSFSGAIEKKIPGKKIFFKRPTPFAIPVGPFPIPCLWWVQGEWGGKVAAKAAGSLNWNIGASVDFGLGVATAGLPQPRSYLTPHGNNDLDGIMEEQEASISFYFKPSLHAACPAHPFIYNLDPENPEKRVPVPVAVSGRIGDVDVKFSDRDSITTLEAALGIPCSAQVYAKACSTKCKEPNKLLEIGGKVGFNAVELVLSAVTKNVELSTPLNIGLGPSKCYEKKEACCFCEETGKPGQLDPKTKECMCECECEAPDGTKVPSFKKKDEECMCDFCPDQKTLERLNEEIKCPCKCKNGEEMEQQSDGTCDCSCLCEDGVTEEEIDENGNCPCECECKNCDKSRIGVDGECDCPNDRCPVCEDGSEGVWQNCECECPDPDCGIPPACAAGRRGHSCDLPNCPECQSCSGQGTCTLGANCQASCRCAPRWTGSCCERRNPNNNWGDPHLETLDGIEFDYFGIGQFWYCKSLKNDFGYQVRYFYYKRTSFTGAVALKAGYSVATVTTVKGTTGEEFPILRIDGTEIDIGSSRSIVLSNSTVTLDIQTKKKVQGDKDDPAVVLLSFQYKAGATLTLDVRYSSAMQRQYLNTMFTPTAAFLENTEGVCGYMDNDETNDLLGPDGTLYNDTTEFTESWRIPVMNRDTGGLYGSWSWSETNFHKDNIPDISYTDPTYSPAYTLEGVSEYRVSQATALCNSLGIKDSKLDGCIFDIVITNDTSFAQQESLQTGCPNQCSGKGRCLVDSCICLDGWSGQDCSVGSCGTCLNGDCVSGFCQCVVGWDGPECDVEATCGGVNDCTDSSHGTCDKIDKCLCVDGYTGADCSQEATCYNQLNCSGNGICVDFDVCRCNLGYKGPGCTQFSCESLDYCSGHGMCIGFDLCLCDAGWLGGGCGTPDCKTLNQCSNTGRCTEPNKCECNEGYSANDCSQLSTCPELHDCTGNGLCVKNSNGSVICNCFDGFEGASCNITDCSVLNQCSGHGICTEPNLCVCDAGYALPDCGNFSCDTLGRCSGHGSCVAFETCMCDPGWNGTVCDTPDCSSINDCLGQGVCLTPDICECFDGYEGLDCGTRSQPNTNPPMFNETEYNVTIYENTKSGKLLVTISGYDVDIGRNGELRYSIDPSGVGIDIPKYLMIDSLSGQIILIESMSREVVPSGFLSISLIVNDKGSPSLSDSAVLNLAVIDINDNCPVFSSPSPGETILVNASIGVNSSLVSVKAQDADFGANGDIKYTLRKSLDDRFFEIDDALGMIYLAVEPIPVGKYSLTIFATDQGTNPCVSDINLIIQVYPSTLPTETLNRVAPVNPTTTTQTTKQPSTPSTGSTTSIVKSSTMQSVVSSSTTVSIVDTNIKSTSMFTDSTKSTETTSQSPHVSTTVQPSSSDAITWTQATEVLDGTTNTPATTNTKSDNTISPLPTKTSSNLPLIITGSVLSAVVLIAVVVILALLMNLRKLKGYAEKLGKKSTHSPLRSVSLPSINDRSDAHNPYEQADRYYR